jgi:hypothetical protein
MPAGQTQGERRSPKRGQSVEFSDFRPYVAGDDFRRIDWNAYARLERFFIKLFVEEEDLAVHLLVDASRSMDWGEPNKLWYATRVAGALGYIALAGLDRVTVTAMGSPTGAKWYFRRTAANARRWPCSTSCRPGPESQQRKYRAGDPAQALRAYANPAPPRQAAARLAGAALRPDARRLDGRPARAGLARL